MPIDCGVGVKVPKRRRTQQVLQTPWNMETSRLWESTALKTLHASARLSSELALKTLCNKMDTGDTALGQKATSRSGETDKASSRWRQEQSAVIKMSTFGSQEGQRQPQIDPEQIGNTASAQLFGSGKLASPSEVAQQVTEKQYPPHRPSPYSCQHSLSFPQHSFFIMLLGSEIFLFYIYFFCIFIFIFIFIYIFIYVLYLYFCIHACPECYWTL